MKTAGRTETDDPKPHGKLRPLLVIGVAIVLTILVVAAIYTTLSAAPARTGRNGYGSGLTGNGTPEVFTMNNTSFNEINQVPGGVLVNKSANSINVTSSDVTLVVEAAPTWYPRQGDFWLAYGLVNPDIAIETGTTIRFVFINMDNITHMPALTTIGPPYGYMPMESGMMGPDNASGMMGYQGSGNGSWLAIGPMLAGTYVQNNDAAYSAANLSVAFNSPGNFWYICLVPGHAQMGMYGEISVAKD